MAKKKAPENRPVEKMAYLEPFRLTADDPQRWILQDYHEQSITDDGALCRDKPIKIRSDSGVEKKLPWGTAVIPVNQTEVQNDHTP